jgi:hypothetical protein
MALISFDADGFRLVIGSWWQQMKAAAATLLGAGMLAAVHL